MTATTPSNRPDDGGGRDGPAPIEPSGGGSAASAGAGPPLRPTGGERLPAFFLLVGILGALGFIVAFALTENTQVLGVGLFLALGGIGVGMVLWAQRFMTPRVPDVEPRGRIQSTEAEIDEFRSDFNVGEYELERRSLLTKLLIGALSAMGLAAVVPFTALGPKPGTSFTETKWRKGKRLVDEQNDPIRAALINVDAVITVFPEGDVGDEFAQTLLIRLEAGRNQPVSGRETWTPNDLIAYSKVCTHVGCPVGLYEAASGELLCPCHQSTFVVYDGAKPVFGPAATPLPQLPLAIDGDGFVVANGDFSNPPGPEFWNQRKP
jgi:ubiquinol-cytochrome c reductase iron-sulfur subunit